MNADAPEPESTPDPPLSPSATSKSGTFAGSDLEAIARMRREYNHGGLSRADLDPDPVAQFERWFGQAREAGVIEPNAMSLATADAEGRPDLRTVLLKGFDARGFVFFTNLESNKARHIAANPNVSLLFPWLLLERQVIIRGRAEKISAAEVLKYFVTRPYGSQLAAWSSPQSQIITARSVLEMKLEEMKRKFAEGKVPVPSFWGGFRVMPRSMEFWQGRPSRLHDRFLYTRDAEREKTGAAVWKLERVAP